MVHIFVAFTFALPFLCHLLFRNDGGIVPWNETRIFPDASNESVNEAELDESLHVHLREIPGVPERRRGWQSR